MIGRNKRGIRRTSLRMRLAVAAAVLVGGGAAGVVAVAVNHSNPVSAQSAGYYTSYRHQLSESHAMSDAMDWWSRSPQTSLSLISRMVPVRSVSLTSFHSHMIAVQRGVVAATAPGEFVTRSLNNQLEVWHTTRGTKFFNVGNSKTGWNAMTGGTMSSLGSWNWSNSSAGHWSMRPTTIAKGDLVFVFGERVHGELVAQLVLFAAPATTTTVTPTATPSMTTTPTAPATPTMTATPAIVNGQVTFSGNHS